MMLGLRAHIEEAEESVIEETEELSVADDIAQEADEKALDSEAAEVEMDNQAMEEAEQLLEESVEADKSADKALETPAEVTEDDVKAASASLESALFALQDKDFYKDQSLKVQAAYEEYGNNPAMRLQACQEGIKETIAKLIETIKNIFRRVIGWFKKQYAKFVAMISRNASKAKKLKVEAKKITEDKTTIEKDEVAIVFNNNQLLGVICGATGTIEPVTAYVHYTTFSKTIPAVKTLIDGINNGILKGTGKTVGGLATSFVKAALDPNGQKLVNKATSALKNALGLDEIYVPIQLHGKTFKAIILEDESLKVENRTLSDFKDLNFKNIEITKDDVIELLTACEKSGKDASKSVKECLKLAEDGNGMVNSLERIQKVVYKNEADGDITEAGLLKATNLGRKLATDIAVHMALTSVKGNAAAIELAAKFISYFTKKSKK